MPVDANVDALTTAEVAELQHVSKAYICNLVAGRCAVATYDPGAKSSERTWNVR